MASLLSFRPYPDHPYPAYWGPVTSSDNYCEEDYLITTYIAEFINTTTNIVYISYSTHGLYKLYAAGRLNVSSALPFIGLIGVGVFSAMFHMTLREWPQLSDDLSMVLPTTLLLCRLLTFQMSREAAIKANAGILSLLVAIYTVHIHFNKHIVHGLTFLFMVAVIANRTRRLLPVLVKDPIVRQKLLRIARFGGASFLFGFILWNIDRRACGTLTRAKRAIGMPLGFLLELHGWWHFFTGIGAYIFIVLADYLVSDRAGMDPGDVFGWPVNYLFAKSKTEALKPATSGVASTSKMNGFASQPKTNGQTSKLRTNGVTLD